MKMIITLIFLSLISIFVTGCATSNLSYKNRELNLRVDKEQLQLHGTQIKSYKNNFSILFLEQKLLHLDDGSLVMYEEAKTDMLYEFAQTTTRSIQIIFDAQRVIKVYENALFYAYQLVLPDHNILNVIVSQSYDQELKMVYGMSSAKLNEMLHTLNPNTLPVYYQNAITLNQEKNPILSHWTTWKINFIPLVRPLPRLIIH